MHTQTHILICKGHSFLCVQFHKEARDTQDLLKRLDKDVSQKYDPEFKDVYQMESLIQELDVSFSLSVRGYISNSLTTDSFLLKYIFLCVCVCVCRTKPKP